MCGRSSFGAVVHPVLWITILGMASKVNQHFMDANQPGALLNNFNYVWLLGQRRPLCTWSCTSLHLTSHLVFWHENSGKALCALWNILRMRISTSKRMQNCQRRIVFYSPRVIFWNTLCLEREWMGFCDDRLVTDVFSLFLFHFMHIRLKHIDRFDLVLNSRTHFIYAIVFEHEICLMLN